QEVGMLEAAIGLCSLAHPRAVDGARGPCELHHGLISWTVVPEQAAMVRGKAFQGLAVQAASAADAFLNHHFAQPGGEWCGVDPGHDSGVAFEEALSAIPGKPRVPRHADEAARSE